MELFFDSNKYFKLFIDFTTKCNLNCSYCFARKIKKWNNEMSIENINILFDILQNTEEKFYLIWFGGEPLLHSKIDYIIEKFSKLKHQNVVLSNGLLDIEKYIKILKKNFILSLTFHENFEKFTETILNLKDYKNNLVINILLEHDKSLKLYDFVIKNNIKYIFTQIYDDNENFINPFSFKKIPKNNIELFQDKKDYKKLIIEHYKIKNKIKICYFNEGLIDINLNYSDECRNIFIDLKKNKNFFNDKDFKKPILCKKACGDCYGKIICNKRVLSNSKKI